jgi:hypothetical protein
LKGAYPAEGFPDAGQLNNSFHSVTFCLSRPSRALRRHRREPASEVIEWVAGGDETAPATGRIGSQNTVSFFRYLSTLSLVIAVGVV